MIGVDPQRLLQRDRRALAKAITLVESRLEAHRAQAQRLLDAILPFTGKSLRVGISGTPGVGKSTFIEAVGNALIAAGKRVAILAVDPSSPVAGGSILGDKTRMETLSRNPEAFIRPSPAGGHLGGVAHKTRESMLLCEAAGFDVIIVETVGVGQSEFDVADMVDFFLVLMQPNAGDDLQGIKKGIMELAEALVINKADGEGEVAAQHAQRHYQNAMNLVAHTGFWTPRVLRCSARENRGIDAVWQLICDYREEAEKRGEFTARRSRQNKTWMEKLFAELTMRMMDENKAYRQLRRELEAQVIAGEITPLQAARQMAACFGF